MERKKASDFPQELIDLLNGYVHGAVSRWQFLHRAEKFAAGGVTAAALFQMLRPNYAWAIQMPPDDKRIKYETVTVPSPKGSGSIKGYLARPTTTDKLPAILVIHENRGLNPYIEDVARRLAVANFIAFAPTANLAGRLSASMPQATRFRSVARGRKCWWRENASSCSVSLAPFSAARCAAPRCLLAIQSPSSLDWSSSRFPIMAVKRLLKSCATPPVR
jgi:carboxymethylenebutenolidase